MIYWMRASLSKVRFSAWQARYIKQRTWHPSQEIEELDNGEIILSFQAGGFYEIKSWILSHGADAEVLEPASPARRNNGDTPKKSEVL